ncbi:asparagine synthase-related protein [[Eubacterium] cellulosolvens]
MGCLIAVIDNEGKAALHQAVQALSILSHRGKDAFGVSTGKEIYLSNDLASLPSVETRIGIAYGLQRVLDSDIQQPLRTAFGDLIFEGEAYDEDNLITASNIQDFLSGQDGLTVFTNFLRKYDGMYTAVLNDGHSLFAMRDPQGLKPLYHGEDSGNYMIVSERKALWNLGINDVKSFPYGSAAAIRGGERRISKIRGLRFSGIKRRTMNLDKTANRILNLLISAIKERIQDVDEVAIAFSGGLDSTILASIAGSLQIRVHLFACGIEGFSDLSRTIKAAHSLKIPLRVISKDFEDLEVVIEKVLWLIEQPDQMKVEIVAPLFWTGMQASEDGFKVLLLGQGADELFGGYKRFQEIYQTYGKDRALRAIDQSVRDSPEINYERDEPIFSACKIRPRLPYTDFQLTQYVVNLPLSMKLSGSSDMLRKRVLRRAATYLSLPSSIIEAKKIAIQYETGVSKALNILAKQHNVKPKIFIDNIFQKIRNVK